MIGNNKIILNELTVQEVLEKHLKSMMPLEYITVTAISYNTVTHGFEIQFNADYSEEINEINSSKNK